MEVGEHRDLSIPATNGTGYDFVRAMNTLNPGTPTDPAAGRFGGSELSL